MFMKDEATPALMPGHGEDVQQSGSLPWSVDGEPTQLARLLEQGQQLHTGKLAAALMCRGVGSKASFGDWQRLLQSRPGTWRQDLGPDGTTLLMRVCQEVQPALQSTLSIMSAHYGVG